MRSLSVLFLSSFCALATLSLSADAYKNLHKIEKRDEPIPWFTGPLLTPSGHVIPNGHYNIEPYLYVTGYYGTFDSQWHGHDAQHTFYNLFSQNFVQIGMPAQMDFTFSPQFSWNHIHGASQWVLNDLPWGFDLQLINDKPGKWWPAVKLQLRANFPCGKFKNLDPKKQRTDLGGTGSWLPGIGLVFSHLYWWGGNVFFSPRFNVQYTIPTAVHVKGFNTYRGGHHTDGTIYPGQNLQLLFGFELSLTQRWVLAADIDYLHINKTRFKGHRGKTLGIPNPIGFPSSEQLSLAPAIEYNWNAYIGIIAGVWFTVAGRNQFEFTSGIVAFNVYK